MLNNYFVAAKMGSAYKDAKAWEEGLLSMVTNNEARRLEELPGFIEFSKKHPISPANMIRQLWAGSRYQFPKTPPGKIQLLGSYGDRLVHPTCSLNIGRAWGLKVEMHPNAGHDIPIDDPAWVLEKLL